MRKDEKISVEDMNCVRQRTSLSLLQVCTRSTKCCCWPSSCPLLLRLLLFLASLGRGGGGGGGSGSVFATRSPARATASAALG